MRNGPDPADIHDAMLDGTLLYDAILSGAGNVILNERLLNRINVFPVPDGDTGTNLALTLRTVMAKAVREPAVSRTMASISSAAVENAYGNSGMIFAQFLHGLSQAVQSKERLTPDEFAVSCGYAAHHARAAVAVPQEGTILTVMHEWAESLKRQNPDLGLEAWLAPAVGHARDVVEQTRNMMRIFRERNVVDSGAKGFLLFLEGILARVRHGGTDAAAAALQLEEEAEVEPVPVEPPRYRYCTQFTLRLDHPSPATLLAEKLAGMGDSLVVGGVLPLAQVHVHADDPAAVMDVLTGVGQVISHKVDDMALQQEMVAHPSRRIAIVTDSIADLPPQWLKASQVLVLPVHIIQDGTAYLDKQTMTHERFFRDVDTQAMHPTSAQPTAASIERVFAFALAHFDAVLGVFVSSQMSGLVRQARLVADRMTGGDGRVRIVDTRLNSAAEGLAVAEAVRLSDEGLPLGEVAERLEAFCSRTRILVSVATLKYMLKGGRVSRVKGALLGLLRLKPVVSIDASGKGSIAAKTFTRHGAMRRMLRQVERDHRRFGVLQYSLVHADDPAVLEPFRRQVEAIVGRPPDHVTPISSVVALNAGRGAFAIAYAVGEAAVAHA